MQFKVASLVAVMAGAVSAQNIAPSEALSILSVLSTALPSSLLSEALTNPAAVSSDIVSQFSAGNTPSWYSALPTDIKTLLAPSVSALESSAGAAPTSSLANATAAIGNGTIVPTGGLNTTMLAGNATGLGTGMTTSTSRSNSGSGSGSSANAGAGGTTRGSGSNSPSSSSTGGAALPTAIYGMALAGAAGLVGVLAL